MLCAGTFQVGFGKVTRTMGPVCTFPRWVTAAVPAEPAFPFPFSPCAIHLMPLMHRPPQVYEGFFNHLVVIWVLKHPWGPM